MKMEKNLLHTAGVPKAVKGQRGEAGAVDAFRSQTIDILSESARCSSLTEAVTLAPCYN